MRRTRSMALLLGLALTVPAGASAAGSEPAGSPTTTLRARIGSCQFSGIAANIPGDTLVVRHRSASGALKATHTLDVSGGGWDVECPGPKVAIGDRIQFFQQGETTPFRVRTIPALVLRPDRVLNQIRGSVTGTPDKVEVEYDQCDPAILACTVAGTLTDIAIDPATGRFSELINDDLRGTTLVILQWFKGSDRIQLLQFAARLVVRPGSATVSGFGSKAGQKVSLSLRRGQAIGLASPTTTSSASFRALFKRAGSPMNARAGDRVSASFASDAVLTVPQTRIELVPGGVEGRCFKNADVTVVFYGADGELQDWTTVQSDDTGEWAVTATILAGTTIKAWCSNLRGDAVLVQLLAN